MERDGAQVLVGQDGSYEEEYSIMIPKETSLSLLAGSSSEEGVLMGRSPLRARLPHSILVMTEVKLSKSRPLQSSLQPAPLHPGM